MNSAQSLNTLNTIWENCVGQGRPFFIKIASCEQDYIHVYEGEKLSKIDSILQVDTDFRDKKLQCFMLPYSAISERGSAVITDELKPMVFDVTSYQKIFITENDRLEAGKIATDHNQNSTIRASNSNQEQIKQFNYAQEELINAGEGCNFVFRRDYHITFPRTSSPSYSAWACFLGLLSCTSPGYWNFAWFDGSHFVIGASPEPLITLRDGMAKMTPISGTHRGELDRRTLKEFLLDEKEIFELDMVLDEELKIMAKLCADRIAVEGPEIIQSGNILHTGFSITGKLSTSVGEALLESLGAPTVVGSPIRSAEKHIASTEHGARGYYAGACGVIRRSSGQIFEMESALVIRSLELCANGTLAKISAGATIVRGSDAEQEVSEIEAKLRSVTAMMAFPRKGHNGKTSDVKFTKKDINLPSLEKEIELQRILDRRSERVPSVWKHPVKETSPQQAISGHLLLVECGDNFIWMIAYILRRQGFNVSVISWSDDSMNLDSFDCLILGPGPGNPSLIDKRSEAIVKWANRAYELNIAVCAICLSHQVLAKSEGYKITRVSGKQGHWSEFVLGDGTPQIFATYNSFQVQDPKTNSTTNSTLDYRKSCGFRSFQWHPESILSENGDAFLTQEIKQLIAESGTLG